VTGVMKDFSLRKLASAIVPIVNLNRQNGNNLMKHLKSTPLTEKNLSYLQEEWGALSTEFPLRTTILLIKDSMNNMLLSKRVKTHFSPLFKDLQFNFRFGVYWA